MNFQNKDTRGLMKICVRKFNEYIRLRDRHEACINCGSWRTLQAGHFYPASSYQGLRFDEDNVNGECLKCNFYDSQSHAYKYRANLIKKIGEDRFNQLELKAQILKGKPYKWERHSLILIYDLYSQKVKELKKWIKEEEHR